ncbi:hypothetical protein Cgig2_032446 [Carnegiea gigantea]|uniref:RNase H type-1 domain-containing protein n=1 Tax=Carnegiea gigantea TaxID=171969 RepID=A0A9Q1KTU9_9CARY|nr:hypothetical protein Cgig2_032446 [Carnegiea gigantea]
MPPSLSALKVYDLIDFDNMRQKEAMIRELFVPCDAKVIMGIPPCASWPNDKFVWHYSADGAFWIQSAYRMIVHIAHQSVGSSSPSGTEFWRTIWALDIPPVSRYSTGGLVGGSDFEPTFWAKRFRSPSDCLGSACTQMEGARFGEFVAVLWECWNARNRFIFKRLYRNLESLSLRAITLVRTFRDTQVKGAIPTTLLPVTWKPPMPGTVKLNFDGGRVVEDGRGWGFIIRDDNGDILMAGLKQGAGFGGALVEEARACLFRLRCTRNLNIFFYSNSSGNQTLDIRSTHIRQVRAHVTTNAARNLDVLIHIIGN